MAKKPEFPEVPTTAITSVETSLHKLDIYNQLVSGWSPARVHQHLLDKYGEDVPTRDIEKFREAIAPQYFLKLGYLARRLKRIDVQVDALAEMVKLLKVAQERLDEALEQEAAAVPFDDPTGISKRADGQTEVAQRLKVYWQMLNDYVDKLVAVGQIQPPTREPLLKSPGMVPTIREILRERKMVVERTQWEAVTEPVPRAVIEAKVSDATDAE